MLVKDWSPHLADTRLRQVTWPDFDKHREYIVEMLRAGVSKATIHQQLRDERGAHNSWVVTPYRGWTSNHTHDLPVWPYFHPLI